MHQRLKAAFRGDIEVGDSGLGDEIDAYDGPYGVIDPRLIGYSYLSYLFVESGDNLSSGLENRDNVFNNDEKALMLGAALGDYDFIGRRADIDQFKHAQFTVDAIDDTEKSFMQNIETYPIFSVGRWHGQNVDVNNMTMRRNVEEVNRDQLEDIESEFVYQMNHNPEADPEDWADNIRQRASVGTALVTRTEFEERIEDNGGPKQLANAMDDYILGNSIAINPANLSQYHHLIMGISVKEGVIVEDDEPYLLPNEKIMDDICENDTFDGWTMPYIVSGVGKSWGDILVELHTDDIDDVEEYAEELRDNVNGVRSTKTFALTGTSFHKPLILDSPGDIRTRE